jgi:hypothetical protein
VKERGNPRIGAMTGCGRIRNFATLIMSTASSPMLRFGMQRLIAHIDILDSGQATLCG